MTTRPLGTHSLIDEFLRDYEFSAAYEILIDAQPSVVYQSLLGSDFSQPWLVRFLMALRTGKWMPRKSEPKELHQRRSEERRVGRGCSTGVTDERMEQTRQ